MNAILLSAALAIIKVPWHSKLDSLEAKGNHLTDIPEKTLALKGTNSSQTSVIVQRNISPNTNLEKLAREAQHLTLEKEKTRLKIQ